MVNYYECMVANLFKKVKDWCIDNRSDLFIAAIIFFTGLSGFGLGRLSVDIKKNPPLFVVQPTSQESPETSSSGFDKTDKRVMASRNGTTYYYPSCSGAKRIKEENIIWFATKEAAASAGLKPAANCSGL